MGCGSSVTGYVSKICFNHPSIERVEDRAMSLTEFAWIRETIASRCHAEGWVDHAGTALAPEGVNLYDLNYYLICPSTAPNGALLTGLEVGKQVARGQIVTQSNPRGGLKATGLIKGVRGKNCLSINLTHGQFKIGAGPDAAIEVDGVSLGQPADVRCPRSISLKELLSTKPMQPRWFASHWWGESIFDFVRCCERHARLRSMDESAASYWVCAYANRQHELAGDISENPAESSFQKAIDLASGVLLILDPKATPFRRIWCDFELYQVLTSPQGKLLDIATVCKGQPEVLSDGRVPGEEAWEKKRREISFPLTLLAEGLRTRLEHGGSTVDMDRVRILNYMTKRGDLNDRGILDRLRDKDYLDRAHYDAANNLLKSRLALVAWPQAVKGNIVTNFDASNPQSLSLPQLLAGDDKRTEIQLDLQTFDEVTDIEIKHIGQGLPPNLVSLELNIGMCNSITHRGLGELVDRLPRSLTRLQLRLAKCEQLSDEALQVIARRLPAALEELLLSFNGCPLITDAGVEAICRKLPGPLRALHLEMKGVRVTDMSMTGLANGIPPNLRKLHLDIYGCDNVSDLGLRVLAEKMPKTIETLRIQTRGSAGKSFHVPGELQDWLAEQQVSKKKLPKTG